MQRKSPTKENHKERAWDNSCPVVTELHWSGETEGRKVSGEKHYLNYWGNSTVTNSILKSFNLCVSEVNGERRELNFHLPQQEIKK